MRVVDYETYAVPPRWLFTRIETDDGQVGWGEHVAGGAGPRVIAAATEMFLERYLVGEDPLRIADLWERMYRGGFYRGGPVLMAAMAGIDIACWDLKGTHYGAPVHDLLGGRVRERVPIYQWVGGDRPGDVAAEAERRVEQGFRALKMNATAELRRVDSAGTVDDAAERLRSVREVVGPDVDVGVDFHGRVSTPMAKRLVDALEPSRPMFVEEPVRPDHSDALPELATRTTIPIAAGERFFTRWEFAPILAAGGVDVAQPDVAHAGGITETLRIASLAETHDAALAPHCPLGPIALAACLQVDAVAPNALIQEQGLDIHYNEGADAAEYVEDTAPLEHDDGFVAVPDGPGLGIDIDRDAVAAAARGDDSEWEATIGLNRPVWRHDDGSVAEW